MKMLYKTADMILDVPPNCPFWNQHMQEHLLIGLVLPFCRFEPWCVWRTPKVHQVQREVQRMLKEDCMNETKQNKTKQNKTNKTNKTRAPQVRSCVYYPYMIV